MVVTNRIVGDARRSFQQHVLMVAAMLTAVGLQGTLAAADTSPANIVLIIADDISWNDLGCYGHPTLKTPHLDALAQQGIRFTNAYLTTSSCSPSRCSLITGRYPHNTGAPELHTDLPEDQVRFPQLLQDAGYYTVISGKQHMGSYATRAFDVRSGGRGPGREEDWVEQLRERSMDQPFFCWFASTDAHRGWTIDETAPEYEPQDVVVPPYLIDDEATRRDLTGYYHEVSRFDTYVGRIVEELKRQDVFDQTLLICIADNGRPFPRCKTRLYDSGIKTPMIVTWPERIDEPAVCDSLVSTIDIAATCLDVAELEPDPRIQGVSFLPVLDDPAARVREVVFAEHNWHVYQNHERMVRFGDWLYIRNNFPGQANLCKEAYIGGAGESLLAAHRRGDVTPAQQMVFRRPCPPEELFRVSSDPQQLTNLANDSRYAEQLELARRLLAEWTRATGDDVPENPTPDRDARPGGAKPPRFRRGAFPGAAHEATQINAPGPLRPFSRAESPSR